MSSIAKLLASVLVALATVPAPRAAANPFGLMFGGCSDVLADTAVDLNASSIRVREFVETWDGTSEWCQPFQERGLDLALTLRNESADGSASDPPADLGAYRERVRDIVATLRPRLLVVENEEDAAVFWSGSVPEYHATLKAACRAAHAEGVSCANGGFTNRMAIVLTYIDFKRRGLDGKADSYAQRATYTDAEYRRLVSSENAASVEAQAREGRSFIKGYKDALADYVNFHWYGRNAKAFAQTVSFLKRKSGLPVISNEIGQYDDDPSTITGLMDRVVRKSMDHAIWFSLDFYAQAVDRTTRALHEPNGTLRPHGTAYKNFPR